MTVIIRTVTRPLTALLLLFSLFLLLRGHHLPGGGFVGGLVAGAAFALYAIAYGAAAARHALTVDPRLLLGIGLIVAIVAGVIGLVQGAFLTGVWTTFHVPLLGALDLGTPLLFDVGVYLIVAGMAMTILFALEEETEAA